ncbi:hypothetical protein [Bounagaea algeriensis]
MAEREIRAVPVDTGVARSRRVVQRRPGWLLRCLRGGADTPRLHGSLYWPIELALAAATVKLPFHAPRRVAVPIARDAVTAHHGVLDLPVREPETVTVPEAEIVQAGAETPESALREFAREQIVRRHRPTHIQDLDFEAIQHLHLPYHVLSHGNSVFLVDRLAERVDYPERHPHAQTATGDLLTAGTAPDRAA